MILTISKRIKPSNNLTQFRNIDEGSTERTTSSSNDDPEELLPPRKGKKRKKPQKRIGKSKTLLQYNNCI